MNEESRSRVPANRKNIQPRPRPIASRKTDSAMYAASPGEKARSTAPRLPGGGGRDQSAPDDGVVVVENGGLSAGDAVRRLVEREAESTSRRLDRRADRLRPIAELRLDARRRCEQPAPRGDARPGERAARPDHDGVRPWVG